jgi:hypothetical protein
MSAKQTFYRLVTRTFFQVWLPDHRHIPKNYWLHWLAVFIATPNRTNKNPLGRYQPQTFLNLVKKFFGWQDQIKLTTPRIIRNVLIGGFILAPINLLTILIQTPISIVKIFTEFLPRLMTNFIERQISILESKKSEPKSIKETLSDLTHLKPKKEKPAISGLKQAAIIGLTVAAIPFYLLHFISRSFTTPVKSFKAAYAFGKRTARNDSFALSASLKKKGYKALSKFFKRNARKLGVAFGVFMTLVSIISTSVTWAFALPYLLQSAGAFVANYITYQGMNSVSTLLYGIKLSLSVIGNALASVISYIPFIGQFIAATSATFPDLIGLCAVAGLVTSTIGVAASNAVENFKKYWYKADGNMLFTGAPSDAIADFGGGTYSTLERSMSFFKSPRSSSNLHLSEPPTSRTLHIKSKPEKSKDYVPEPEDDYSESSSLGYSRK